FLFAAEEGIRDVHVTGVQTCALPILRLVQREIANLEREQAEAEKELARLDRLQRDRADQYNRRLVAVYKYGPLSYLELLVAAERAEERRVGGECSARCRPAASDARSG